MQEAAEYAGATVEQVVPSPNGGGYLRDLKIHPRGSWVLVERVPVERGDIVRVGSSRVYEYVVREIGTGRMIESGEVVPLRDIALGDRILFDDRAKWPTEKVGKRVFVLIAEDAILATYEGDREF